MIDQVAKKSEGTVDALLAVAGVDTEGPATIAIHFYGALATLEGLRPLLLKSSAPRAVAVSSIGLGLSIRPATAARHAGRD
jgi:hypothetical protein